MDEETIWLQNTNMGEPDRLLVQLVFECVDKVIEKKKNQSIFKFFSSHFNSKEGDEFKLRFQHLVYYFLSRDFSVDPPTSEWIAQFVMNQILNYDLSDLVTDEYEFVARVFYYSSKFLTSRNQLLVKSARNFWKKHIQLRKA